MVDLHRRHSPASFKVDDHLNASDLLSDAMTRARQDKQHSRTVDTNVPQARPDTSYGALFNRTTVSSGPPYALYRNSMASM